MNRSNLHLQTSLKLLFLLVSLLWLPGCKDSSIAGIEGSGAPAIAARGPINNNDSNSTTVNGINYDSSEAEININGANSGESELAPGQVVTITTNTETGKAINIDFIANIRGPISAIDPLTNTLIALNQVVAINNETQLGDGIELNNLTNVAIGTFVEVSGLLTASGELIATRIDKVATVETVAIIGLVSELDTNIQQFFINDLAVHYDNAHIDDTTTLTEGQLVYIQGTLNEQGELIVSHIRKEKLLPNIQAQQTLDITALISHFSGPDNFIIDGIKVSTNSSTIYVGGTEADLALNSSINVKGIIVKETADADGLLVANSIEFIPINTDILITSIVQAVELDNDNNDIIGNMTLLGLSVSVSVDTDFKDSSDIDSDFTHFTHVQTNDRLDVRAIYDGKKIITTQITRLNPGPNIRLRGIINETAEGLIIVQGVIAFTSPLTRFIDINGNTIAQSVFIEKSPGASVLIEGSMENNNIQISQAQLIASPNGSLLIGTPGKDTLIGTDGDDVILGDDNNDILIGAEGNDELHGGEGDDSLYGDEGDDQILGGPGQDRLYPGLGSDTVDGGADRDIVNYQNSNAGIEISLDGSLGIGGYAEGDTLYNIIQIQGSQFDDILMGNNEDYNLLEGFGGNDQLFAIGGHGNTLRGYAGDDTLHGGAGQDLIVGHEGDDQLFGHHGNDSLHPGAGIDTVDGGNGIDVVYYDDSPAGIDIGLGGQPGIGGHAEGNILLNVEKLSGSEFNDVLHGTDAADQLFGKEGDDEIYGGAGKDLIFGDKGNDQLFGEAGEDRLFPGAGLDTIDGGADTDTVYYDRSPTGITINLDGLPSSGGDAEGDRLINIENVEGSNFSDHITGNNERNRLVGRKGDDQLFGLDGSDNYHFAAGSGKDQINEDSSNTTDSDTVTFFSSLSKNDLWLSRRDNHLIISVINTADQVQINNWFADGPSIEFIETQIDSTRLSQNDIPSLIDAMSFITPNDTGVFTVSASDLNQVLDAINTSWK